VDRIRVTAQLLNVADGKSLWSGQFSEPFTDIFNVEDSISSQMAEALLRKLTDDEQKLVKKHPTESVEAYELYLKGRFFLDKVDPDSLRKSIDYFQQALEKDPKYALAFAGLADAYVVLAVRADMAPRDSYQKAKVAATRALEIDDSISEAHTSLAKVRFWYDWDWSGAESESKRAIQLGPNSPAAHQQYAVFLMAMERQDEAASQIIQAQRLAPVSFPISAQVARVFFFAHRYDDVVDQCRKTLELDPNFAGAHMFLGRSYTHKRMYPEALAELDEARKAFKDSAEVLAIIGYTYGVAGRRLEAQKMLNELQQLSKERYISPYHLAMIDAGLGKKDNAFAELDKAYTDREGRMTLLKVVPEFANLRSDPRFTKLLQRIGLNS